MATEWIKAYKGFDKNMQCRGFQFEEGKEYSLPDGEEAKLCEKGFHACEAPVDCIGYYPAGTSVFREVELEATDEKSNDTKRVGKRIKIGAEISVAQMVNLHFEYVREHCTNENNAESGKAASAGYRGAACSRGSASVAQNGIACARGNGCRVRGGLGSILVIAEESKTNYDITA